MLKEARILNYENHKKTHLIFVPGTNIIIGPNDNGKSAIRRAVEWPIKNRPVAGAPGNEAEESRVTLVFEDNSTKTFACRGRTGKTKYEEGKNYYLISGEKDSLKAFKLGVPKQVSELININPDSIQTQADQYYLFDPGVTPGKLAKRIHDILGLSLIDETNKVANEIITKCDSINSTVKADIEESQKKVNELLPIKNADKKMKELEEAISECVEINVSLELANSLARKYSDLRRRYEARPKVSSELRSKLEDLRAQLEKLPKLNAAFERIQSLQTSYAKKTEELWELGRKSVDISTTKPLEKLVSDYKVLHDSYIRLTNIQEDFAMNKKRIGNIAESRKALLKKKKKAEKIIKICPLCGGKFKQC